MVKFGGVGIADKKVTYGTSKGEGGGVGVVAGKHGCGDFGLTVSGKE